MSEQEFHPGSVPVAVAARVYGKDASWVRAGIVSGWLPIGKATRNGKLVTSIEEIDSRYGRTNFYISPKLLYEETGFYGKEKSDNMPTNVRPEVSKKNPYYIEHERYYELKHFCRQYPIWKKAYAALDGLSRRPADLELFSETGETSDPTFRCVAARERYSRWMGMVEQCAREADPELYKYLMSYVTKGDCYSVLKMRDHIPCCKDVFYETARKFFWLLNKVRD